MAIAELCAICSLPLSPLLSSPLVLHSERHEYSPYFMNRCRAQIFPMLLLACLPAFLPTCARMLSCLGGTGAYPSMRPRRLMEAS